MRQYAKRLSDRLAAILGGENADQVAALIRDALGSGTIEFCEAGESGVAALRAVRVAVEMACMHPTPTLAMLDDHAALADFRARLASAAAILAEWPADDWTRENVALVNAALGRLFAVLPEAWARWRSHAERVAAGDALPDIARARRCRDFLELAIDSVEGNPAARATDPDAVGTETLS